MTQQPLVLVSADQGVVRLTLNRPDRLNAFNAAMSQTLISEMKKVAADPTVRVVVLTGAGRGFCAGQDLSDDGVDPTQGEVNLGKTLEDHYIPLIELLAELRVPVIAAVNGVAAGAGASLALACDIVIATSSASFLQPFAKIGLLPDAGGTYFLPRAIGTPWALALALTGEKLTADQAHAMGMIWKATPDDAFAQTVDALARHLAASAPRSLTAIKKAIRTTESRTLAQTLRYERDAQQALGRSADFAEGVKAFAEKRAAHFSGK